MLYRQHPVREGRARGRCGAGALAAAVAVAALLPLQACAEGVGVPAHRARPPGMSAAPMKPTGSGVALDYRIEGVPQVGRALTVTLRFEGVTDPAGGSVRLAADGGLALTGDAAAQIAHALPAGRATTLRVQVVPGEGLGYLHVFTTQNGSTSANSIPVQVGKATPARPAADGVLKQAPGGERLLTLPVK